MNLKLTVFFSVGYFEQNVISHLVFFLVGFRPLRSSFSSFFISATAILFALNCFRYKLLALCFFVDVFMLLFFFKYLFFFYFRFNFNIFLHSQCTIIKNVNAIELVSYDLLCFLIQRRIKKTNKVFKKYWVFMC